MCRLVFDISSILSIMYVLGTHDFSIEEYSTKIAVLETMHLNSAKKHNCGIIVQRCVEDEKCLMRTHEPDSTQSDMEEFVRKKGE